MGLRYARKGKTDGDELKAIIEKEAANPRKPNNAEQNPRRAEN